MGISMLSSKQTTRERDGQRILRGRVNQRYPCWFVYRKPNILSLGEELWRRVDALTDPHEFLHMLEEMQRALLKTI
jgi:hypothetical protein